MKTISIAFFAMLALVAGPDIWRTLEHGDFVRSLTTNVTALPALLRDRNYLAALGLFATRSVPECIAAILATRSALRLLDDTSFATARVPLALMSALPLWFGFEAIGPAAFLLAVCIYVGVRARCALLPQRNFLFTTAATSLFVPWHPTHAVAGVGAALVLCAFDAKLFADKPRMTILTGHFDLERATEELKKRSAS